MNGDNREAGRCMMCRAVALPSLEIGSHASLGSRQRNTVRHARQFASFNRESVAQFSLRQRRKTAVTYTGWPTKVSHYQLIKKSY